MKRTSQKRESTVIVDFLNRNKFIFIAFLLPLALMLIGFITIGIYPFGKNQVMVIDMWHQYFPFLVELQEKLTSFSSLLYSWNTGLGTNFLALMGYYAASPLYLLSVLFPKEHLTEFLALCILIKIGFSGSAFAVYLRGKYGHNDMRIAAFGTMYALCAFAVGYYWNIMWLDGVALLPLIILGLDKMIECGKFKMFTVSLAVALISNYYIGAFICMFVAVYYITTYIATQKLTDWRGFINKTVRALGFSLLAVCAAAVMIIPVYCALQLASASNSAWPASFEFYENFFDIINNMLVANQPTSRDGLPNIYCGFFALYLFVIYMTSSAFKLRERITYCVLLVFLILSFNINYLDFIWHGFHFPNELPYRFSFCFSFILLALAYRIFSKMSKVSKASVITATSVLLAYMILVKFILQNVIVSDVVFYVTLGFFAVYATMLLLYKFKVLKRFLAFSIIIIFIIGECSISAIVGANTVGSSDRSSYAYGWSDIESLLDSLNEQDNSFYRVETNKTFTINNSALYSYRGISQFSSSANSNVSELITSLGLSGGINANRYTYQLSTPVINSMLSLKYLINRNGTISDPYFDAIGTSGNVNMYRNKYFLPIGYMTNSNVKNWDISSANPFIVQNNYIYNATGGQVSSVFTPMTFTDSEFENIAASDGATGYFMFSSPDTSTGGSATLTYTATGDNMVYVYVKSSYGNDVTVTMNDFTVTEDLRYGHIITAGRAKAGDTMTVKVTTNATGSNGTLRVYAYEFNENTYNAAYNMLSQNPFSVTRYSDTQLTGTVTANTDGVLYTSIPYEEGWSCYVDGEEVEITPLGGAFISVDITQGTHTVIFKYTPKGFILGLTISIAAVLIIITLAILSKKRGWKFDLIHSKAHPAEPEPPDIGEIE